MNERAYIIETLVNKFPVLDVVSFNGYSIAYLAWNLILILVPFFICRFLFFYWRRNKTIDFRKKFITFLLFFAWLVFIPNTAYIITDIRHLINFCPIINANHVCLPGAWLIIFYFCYGAAGWVSYVFLVYQMKVFISQTAGKKAAQIYNILIIPLISLGLMLGLIARFNSWEIFIDPIKILNSSLWFFYKPLYLQTFLVYTLSLYILYFSGRKLFKFDGLFKNKQSVRPKKY